MYISDLGKSCVWIPSTQPQGLWQNQTVALIMLLILAYQDFPEQESKGAKALWLKCIVKVLQRGGSVAVSVFVIQCDRWHVTGDTWHVTLDRWEVRGERWQVTDFFFIYFFLDPLIIFFFSSWQWWYYPHWSRDSVSPVCGNFDFFIFIKH